jgi:hypothetical protein
MAHHVVDTSCYVSVAEFEDYGDAMRHAESLGPDYVVMNSDDYIPPDFIV